MFVCVVDHVVNEGEPVDEQYCEQTNEDQFHDPEPEGQCFDQDHEMVGVSCFGNVSGSCAVCYGG